MIVHTSVKRNFAHVIITKDDLLLDLIPGNRLGTHHLILGGGGDRIFAKKYPRPTKSLPFYICLLRDL